MTNLPTPINGTCSHCGHKQFTLAETMVHYIDCSWDAEKKEFDTTHEFSAPQPSDAEDALRFWCYRCGTHHEVPEELS